MGNGSGRIAGTILLAGALGCVLIDLYLIVTIPWLLHATPIQISQWDASNALGVAAFNGGMPAALLGFAMHLCVSVIWAAIFVAVALRFRWVLAHPVVSGITFGLVVMVVMRYLIVPLGHAHQPAGTAVQLVNQILAHVAAFGVPVALVVSGGLGGARVRAPASN
jgi:uncharacterized membrane protein YagU involved in acid resistance